MRPSVAAAVALFAVTASLAVADEVFVVTAGASYPSIWAALSDALDGPSSLVFAGIGLVIVVRRRNAVGWLLCALGLLVSVFSTTSAYARTLPGGSYLELRGEAVWLAPWWVIAGSIAWLVAVTLLAVFVQVFPDGRPLSPRWRLPLLLTLVWPVTFVAVTAFGPLTTTFGKDIPNPNGLGGPVGELLLGLRAALGPWALLGALTAIGSVLLRFRRSTGRERAQLKWFAYAVVVALIPFTLTSALLPSDVSSLVNGLLLTLLPLSVAMAIFRHRLYDIDVLINRTLVYGATTAVIAGAFFAGVVVFEALLRPITSGSEIAVAVSTLASVALVQPLRRRIQDAVDRRFYRSRYDAVRTVDEFSARLRDEVDLDAVRADLVSAARETVQPAHASLWLRAE